MSGMNGPTDASKTDDVMRAWDTEGWICPPGQDAADEATPTADPPSPCIGICRLDSQRLCEGCYRTPEEIGRWSVASAAEKTAIWRQLVARRSSADQTSS